VEKRDLGTHVMDGHTLPLPPILLGSYGNDPKKITVLVYGQYHTLSHFLSHHTTLPPGDNLL
jgi:hypothetical protein